MRVLVFQDTVDLIAISKSKYFSIMQDPAQRVYLVNNSQGRVVIFENDISSYSLPTSTNLAQWRFYFRTESLAEAYAKQMRDCLTVAQAPPLTPWDCLHCGVRTKFHPHVTVRFCGGSLGSCGSQDLIHMNPNYHGGVQFNTIGAFDIWTEAKKTMNVVRPGHIGAVDTWGKVLKTRGSGFKMGGKVECPECFGTGLKGGFHVACSRGCPQ